MRHTFEVGIWTSVHCDDCRWRMTPCQRCREEARKRYEVKRFVRRMLRAAGITGVVVR